MRWAVKTVIPIDEDDATVTWDYFPLGPQSPQDARARALSRRLPTLPVGSRVHTHQCFNDEPDETRRGCVIDRAWEKQASGWMQVT